MWTPNVFTSLFETPQVSEAEVTSVLCKLTSSRQQQLYIEYSETSINQTPN